MRDLRAKLPHLPEGQLRRLARRQATILKYIAARFRPQVRVGPEAVRALYDREYASLAEPPAFEEVAPALERRLVDQVLDERIEAWVRELRASSRVRYNAGVE